MCWRATVKAVTYFPLVGLLLKILHNNTAYFVLCGDCVKLIILVQMLLVHKEDSVVLMMDSRAVTSFTAW